MPRGPVEINARLNHPIQGLGQRCPGRIKDGGVEQSGGPRSRRMAILAFPGVQADVMVIAARRNERRARGQALHQLESQHTAIKSQRAIEIGHLEMNMPDAGSRDDGCGGFGHEAPPSAWSLGPKLARKPLLPATLTQRAS